MDPSSIPKQYGGDLDWTWGDMPNLDNDTKELIGGVESGEGDKKEFLKGPMLFDGDKIQVLGREKKGEEKDGVERRWDIPVAANGATGASTPAGDDEKATETATAAAPAPVQVQA